MFDIKTSTKDFISIVLTHACTRNCPFCIDKYRNCGLEISDEHFLNGLQFAKKKNIKDVLLVGGEPTLHPRILQYARHVKEHGFRLLVTSNCAKINTLYELDQYVDCFNFSHYDQPMPDAKRFKHADITICKLLYKGGIDTKEKLDVFINKHQDEYHLKFSTMTPINEWAYTHNVNFLDALPGERIRIFDGEIPAIIYNGIVIKRHDAAIDAFTPVTQSYKCLANGQIKQDWNMDPEPHFSRNEIYERKEQ